MNLFLSGGDATLFGIEPLWLAIALIVLGLAFLAAEIFIIPGFGVAGVLGILFLVGGSTVSWVYFGPLWGAITVALTVMLATAIGVAFFKSKLMKKRLVLDTHLETGGAVESEDLSVYVGKRGVTRSDLRPAGIAEVDDTRLDVVSEGGFIERDENIEVVAVDGPRVIVARLNQTKENE